MTIASTSDNLPLAINLIGPMAFRKNDKLLDIWLPSLDPKYPHQAAVGTDIDSFVLGDLSDYSIDNPNPPFHPSLSTPHNPPPAKPSVPCERTPIDYPPNSYFVHLTLPRPKWIVGLSPVSCKVYDDGTQPPSDWENKPVGFRLLYGRTGKPFLADAQTQKPIYEFQFDPVADEKQLEIFVAYSPYDFEDYNHGEAKDDFRRLGNMFGLSLNVDFELPFTLGAKRTEKPRFKILNGPAKDCKAPALVLT